MQEIIWQVTTEGDCEGRSTKTLGYFKGGVDEIAMHLANQCYYTLSFSKIEVKNAYNLEPTGVSVEVNNYGSSVQTLLDNCNSDDITHEMKGHNSIIFKQHKLSAEQIKMNNLKAKALSKLSAEERQALGL